MKKLLSFILVAMVVSVWIACNDDKKQINDYLEKNYSDREVKVVGEVVPDSVFCRLSILESTKLEVMGYRAQLMLLLDQDPDSAYRLAKTIKEKYANENTLADLVTSKGNNNRVAYQVQCTEDGKKRYITFYKSLKDETIQYSSFDVEDMEDSLYLYYNLLMTGVDEIVKDRQGGKEGKDMKEKAQETTQETMEKAQEASKDDE